MQRRLIVIRHAQAANGAADVDRPLTGHGADQAAALGTWLQQAGLAPDRVVVSPARRAGQTWEAAAAQLPTSPPPIVDERIYDNTVEAVLAVIQETPDEVGTLAVVGHNPAVGELARALDGGNGDPTALDSVHRGFPPGGVAVFTLASSFAALEPGAGTLSDFAAPAR